MYIITIYWYIIYIYNGNLYIYNYFFKTILSHFHSNFYRFRLIRSRPGCSSSRPLAALRGDPTSWEILGKCPRIQPANKQYWWYNDGIIYGVYIYGV